MSINNNQCFGDKVLLTPRSGSSESLHRTSSTVSEAFHEGLSDLVAPRSWVETLSEAYGLKLVIALVVSQQLVKGLGATLMWNGMDYTFRDYKVDGPSMQIYQAMACLPWALKPLLGVLSDTTPLFGFHKAPYIAFSVVVGLSGFIFLGVNSSNSFSLPLVVGGFLAGCMFLMTVDLLTEAKYAEKMRESPECGPSLITFIATGRGICSLLGMGLVGLLIEYRGPQWCLLVAVVPAALMLPITFFNFLGESPIESRAQLNSHLASLYSRGYGEVVVISVVIFLCSAAVNFLAMVPHIGARWIAGLSLMACVVMLGTVALLLKPVIAKVTIFFMVQASLAVSIEGAAFYFFTDDATQFPGGPNFSPVYYTTVLGAVSEVFSLIGLIVYYRSMREWSFRKLMVISNGLHMTIGLVQCFIFLRWNLLLGISDRWFVVGGIAFHEVVRQWMWMPGMVIMAQLCPPDMEGTMYALLKGATCAGHIMAKHSGAFVLSALSIQPRGSPNEVHQFANLWKAALISACLPCITLVLIPLWIPAGKQTEAVLEKSDVSAVQGSIWRRLTRSKTADDAGFLQITGEVPKKLRKKPGRKERFSDVLRSYGTVGEGKSLRRTEKTASFEF